VSWVGTSVDGVADGLDPSISGTPTAWAVMLELALLASSATYHPS
jgi:hypothetical protein